MRLSKHKQAVLALIIANFIWGAASPIFKWSLTNIEPFTLAFFRFLIPSLIIFPFALKSLSIKRNHLLNLLMLSLAATTFNISFFFLGLKTAPSINAPIIATAGPLFLLLSCFFILKEKIKPKIILGTLIGFCGVILIILQPLLETGRDGAIVGNLFFIIATISGVLHAVFAKKIMPFYKVSTVTFWTFFIGTLTFFPLMIIESQTKGLLVNLSFEGISGIIFGAIFSSLIAYYLYHFAIKNILAQEVGVFAYLDPIIAVIIAAPLLGEFPTPIYILGSVFVFLGIFIAEGRLPYHPIHKLLKDDK